MQKVTDLCGPGSDFPANQSRRMEWTSDVASVVSSLRRAAAGYVPCTEWPFDVAAVVSNLHKAVAGGYGPEGEVVAGLLLEAFHRWSCHSNERTQHSDFDGASANSVRHHVTSTSRQNAAAPTGFGENGRHCHGGDIFGRISARAPARTVNDANPAPESSSDGAPSEVATPGESLRCVCPLLRPLEVRSWLQEQFPVPRCLDSHRRTGRIPSRRAPCGRLSKGRLRKRLRM